MDYIMKQKEKQEVKNKVPNEKFIKASSIQCQSKNSLHPKNQDKFQQVG